MEVWRRWEEATFGAGLNMTKSHSPHHPRAGVWGNRAEAKPQHICSPYVGPVQACHSVNSYSRLCRHATHVILLFVGHGELERQASESDHFPLLFTLIRATEVNKFRRNLAREIALLRAVCITTTGT